MRAPLRRSLILVGLATGLVASIALRPAAQTRDRHNPIRAAYMRAHFQQVVQLHDLVARGDLPGARRQASSLVDASPREFMPVGAEAFRGALTSAAEDAAEAPTLAAAAQATASMLATCGQCHKAHAVRAAVPGSGDIKVGGFVGHMLLHQHGLDALLEGLVAPSDAQWGEGVRTFASPRIEREHVPGSLRRKMDAGETALATLAGHAAQADRTRERAEIYGRILATCGTCHGSTATFAGPDRR